MSTNDVKSFEMSVEDTIPEVNNKIHTMVFEGKGMKLLVLLLPLQYFLSKSEQDDAIRSMGDASAHKLQKLRSCYVLQNFVLVSLL